MPTTTPSNAPLILAITHAAATLSMAGLLWFVQVVHYPLFASVGRDAFPAYESAHQARTTLVVAPLMLAEAATAGLMLAWRPRGVPAWALYASVASVAAVWGLTFLLAVPLHQRLAAGFEPKAHAALVAANWPRTILWTARAALALFILVAAASTPKATRPLSPI